MMPRKHLLSLAVAFALTGCGTTVRLPSSASGPDSSGLSTQEASGSVGSPITTPVAGRDTSGGVATALGQPGNNSLTSGTGASYGAGATQAARTGKVPNSPKGPAPLASPKAPLRLGVVVPDATALIEAFGGTATSDIFAPYKSMIAYIDAHGGIDGHQIDPVYVKEDATSQDGASAMQAACTSVTQDHKVDVVLTNGLPYDVYLSCLQKAGLSSFDPTPWVADTVDLSQHPNFFAPDAMGVDRYVPALIKTSASRGILKAGDTLGVLIEDCPWGSRVYNNDIVPIVRSYGVKSVTASFSCVTNLSGQEVADASSETQQAVLRFRGDGVTDVMVVSAAEGFIVDQFQTNASQQKYYPQYLITTNAFPYNNSHSNNAAVSFSSDSLKNMSGIGFLPYIDLGGAKPATSAQASERSLCQAMDPNYQQQVGSTPPAQATNGLYTLCDLFLTLEHVLTADGFRFDIANLTSAFQQALGTSTGAALTGGGYAPSSARRDGVGQVQPFIWNSAANDFVYLGSPVPVT